MHGKGALMISGNNSQGWLRGQDGLMTQKDNVMCSCFKVIKRKKSGIALEIAFNLIHWILCDV